MVTAAMVAMELRKLAETLELEPLAEIKQAYVSFYHDCKQPFLNTVRLMPHPLTKRVDDSSPTYPRLKVDYQTDAIHIATSVPQSVTCTLIEPAKPAVYDCPSLLSIEEESALGAF